MKSRNLAKAIFSASLVSTATLVAQLQTNAVIQGPFYIVGYQSKKCVDLPRSNPANNVVIDIYTCYRGSANLRWSFEDTTGDYKRIRNLSSKKCLTVLNASKKEYQRVIQYDCGSGGSAGGANAEWRPQKVSPPRRDLQSVLNGPPNPDWYQLRNRNSNMCLTVLNARTSNNTQLMQYPCGGSQNNFVWTWFY
ncbi:RICIN domain-containing protein [uncultured Nostoc sp.]|uniref:RICIN domain-containing protein n=1 Tax=uncultured Nostoc sp. TaxID=340711 RepID=UPI0035CC1721